MDDIEAQRGQVGAATMPNQGSSSSVPRQKATMASGKRSGLRTPPQSPGYAGVTIFKADDRPDLQMMESYAVGRPSSPRREGTGLAMFKTASMPLQRSRSQKGAASTPLEAKAKSRQSLSRPRVAIATPDETRNNDGQAASSEMPEIDGPPAATTVRQGAFRERLSEFHARYPALSALPTPLLPIVAFPLQGTGRQSEFAQDAPIWARQPYKILYFIYFGLSVGLVFLPWFAFVSLFPSHRGRPSWTWKKSTLIKLYRHGTRLTFRTHTALSRDLSKEVPHSQTIRAKFVWVEAVPESMIRGEVRRMLDLQGLKLTRTCGFWYGERDGGGGVGQKAAPGEKVVYHLHGGAYWIGTAHEKDVTSAVNVQVLKALDSIYSQRMPNKAAMGKLDHVRSPPSPHPPHGGPASGNGGLCRRSFSLDYRLCVPGRPEVGSFPAPLVDALAGYRYLVNECDFEPRNIIVAGDSAGGNLALALCRYLREAPTRGLEMPGAMVLLSPWTDTSRSHAGPLTCPNKADSVYRNRHTDIIANSTAFRNTAVSALLGKMPARECYKNPYLSAISLQLEAKDGGAGPHWGFAGFPRRVYICTGTAEISYDQHLTLAYRLAAGTHQQVPRLVNGRCSKDADPNELAARLRYPRPDDHEITVWPSAHTTPAETPAQATATGEPKANLGSTMLLKPLQSAVTTAGSALEAMSGQKRSHGVDDGKAAPAAEETKERPRADTTSSEPHYDDAIKEHDTAQQANNTYEQAESSDQSTTAQSSAQPSTSSTLNGGEQAEERGKKRSTSGPPPVLTMSGLEEQGDRQTVPAFDTTRLMTPSAEVYAQRSAAGSQSYFDLTGTTEFQTGQEDRTVVLDECVDGIHDYTLFKWFEPERGQTWARIAQWIDEEV